MTNAEVSAKKRFLEIMNKKQLKKKILDNYDYDEIRDYMCAEFEKWMDEYLLGAVTFEQIVDNIMTDFSIYFKQ